MEYKAPILRWAVTGAVTLILLFVLCWLGTLVWPSVFSHLFVTLFTVAPTTSWLALIEGVCSALIFGFLAGTILACSYNWAAWTERKANWQSGYKRCRMAFIWSISCCWERVIPRQSFWICGSVMGARLHIRIAPA